MKNTTQDIRQRFLDYFKQKGHAIVQSSAVVPFDDPTILFTNAGMNQFKDLFLGKARRDLARAATSQKCVRAGGKHNDLENVGHTSRHLTFFEMLGNFSFGDYFKKEAIDFAWEVATQVFGFDPKRIWPTVYKEDKEALELWKQYVPEERITKMGEKDNFWSMGETGPCGPCSELLYDRGSSWSSAKNPAEDTEGERFLEFWNLVFMQYDRQADGSLKPLPKPSIDTGSGLERVVMLLNGKDTVFETDILGHLIAAVAQLSGINYNEHDSKAAAFRVIADHVRTLAFAIADGAVPSNIERGYVLRKILRRAVRYGRQLQFQEPFLAKLLPTLIQEMGADYPELAQAKTRIEEVLTREEEQFLKTLKRGGALFNQVLERSQQSGIISGEDAFYLKDTYGLPFEEIVLLAIDSGLKVDEARFKALEEEARLRSKGAQESRGAQAASYAELYQALKEELKETPYLRDERSSYPTEVLAILTGGARVEALQEGESGFVFLKETPFYAEMGGQIGDQGVITAYNVVAKVLKTISPINGLTVHEVEIESGVLNTKQAVIALIDQERRRKVECNHTATHLLHEALQKIIGEHARQAGSVVDVERLRFDFYHHKALSEEEMRLLEQFVNQRIRENHQVKTYEIPYFEAQRRTDIQQFFGEKYGSVVRVVEAGSSKELCGGTHINATGAIGYFRIAKESSIAAGVRRIEAVTGRAAEMVAEGAEELIAELATIVKSTPQKVAEALKKQSDLIEQLQKEIDGLKRQQLEGLMKSLFSQKTPAGRYVIQHLFQRPGLDMKTLSEMVSVEHPEAIVVVGNNDGHKAHLLIKTPKSSDLNANELLQIGLKLVQGKGGGKKEMAQGAGSQLDMLPQAISSIFSVI